MPGYARAWNNLGNALRAGGRLAEAARRGRARGRRRSPITRSPGRNLGALARDLGDDAAARDALRRALALQPDLRGALMALAGSRASAALDEAAISSRARHRERRPEDANAMLQLAGALAERDDLDAARGAFRRAREREGPACCAPRSARR